ncbi:MAG: class I mannose-6-phosphate isomerase [Novosphingobium sp.]|nr:class I mannose-6-phosphate isomerase [Novosphingobium sp.]
MSTGLPVRAVEKPWGVDRLPAPFVSRAGSRIGEIWFEPPAQLPDLLVKYIFTSEALSVQVHPSDAQTLAAGLGRQGKEECWLIVDAQPGAVLGIGFREVFSVEQLREAALDGSIEALLEWHPVQAGDFFYIPANTVHAIGAGVSLIEVQQNSDITYRLYDYGRPRELHLDEGLAVAMGAAYPARLHQKVPDQGNATLVEGPLFRLDQITGPAGDAVMARYGQRPLLVIPRHGTARIGGDTIVPGGCGIAPALDTVTLDAGTTCLLAQPLAGG